MTALPDFLPRRPRRVLCRPRRPRTMLDRPRESPHAVGSDPLSAVLRAVRLRGAVYFLVDASPPWVAEAPAGKDLAPVILPGSQHLIEYHVVTRGTCYGGLVDAPPIELHAGDVIVFPQGDAHVMSSAPHLREPMSIEEFKELARQPLPVTLRMGSRADASAEVVCGFLGCDARPFNPLLASLPRVLHVRAGEHRESGYLRALIELTLTEARARSAGGACMLAGLSELMFVEVVRRYLQTMPPGQLGWLAGLRDEVVGRALTLLHARPARDWTLELLAEEACSSRSALAERFKELLGLPPMQYLAQWRMQLAAGLLAQGNANVSAVAFEVGYASEAAFSRAFKKLVGLSPSAWREQQSAATASAD